MQNVQYAIHADKIAAEVIDGEVIIINVETGTYYNTEGSGGWAWERCAEGRSLQEMAEQGSRVYDVAAETMADDLRTFFATLQEEGLLAASDVALAVDAADAVTPEARLPYAPAKLVIYRDLKDLLALDPPMPRMGGAGASAGALASAKQR